MRSLAWKILVLSLVYFASGAAAQRGCGPPPRYPHTELHRKYADKRSFGSGQKIYYRCGQDFTGFSGSPAVQCVNGRWSRLTLKCQKKSCGNAGELAYGEYEYEGNTYIGKKVYAKCNKGYSLRGPSYRICKASGWSSDTPTCEVGEPTGELTCQHPTVSNSVRGPQAAAGYKVGESLSFTCSPGFQLDGAQQVTCGVGGRWQPKPPNCLPSPTAATGSEASRAPAATGSEASRAPAATGSEASRAPAATGSEASRAPAILADGTAATVQQEKEGASPSVPKECGAPPASGVPETSLAYKYVSMTTFASGYRVHYLCDEGYQQAGGSRYRKCVDGTWTPLLLRCQRKLCGSAGEILYGQFLYTGVEFGDTATAVCDQGYRLVGRATRHCLSRGWDGRVPVCQVMDCDEPPVVKDADMEGREDGTYTFGNVVRYRCRVGTLIGPQEVSCTKSGAWSDPPTCKQITCSPPADHNAFWAGVPKTEFNYRDTITVQCRRGYQLTSTSSITCGVDGQWLPQAPRCIRVARQNPRHG